MDGNSWRPAQGQPGMVSNDWRSELSAESRQRIVNKIMETLKKHLPISGPEGVAELNKIAVRFEEKIYTAATSQSDYLRKISLKMLTMESKSTTANPLASNSAVGNQNPQDSAVNSMQQVRNQGQSLPLANQSQGRQQILAQNLQNSVASGTVQNTPNLTPALSSMSGISQGGLSNVVSQSSTVQSISGISQNAVSNSMGQGIPQSMFPNSQRQLQARQLSQQVTSQQQQQPQGQQHILYQQHLQHQHQLIKQKLQQGNMQSSLLQQSHIQQQQSLLQPNQLQPSQQPHMQASQQPSLQPSQSAIQQPQTSQMQSVQQSGLQQSQHSSLQQSVPSVLQQHTNSVLRHQQQQQQSVMQPQPSMANQQQPQINQASMISSQQQQQLMTQQTNSSGIQQNQIMGQQNIVPDIQQQQRLLAQQSFSNMHQQQQMLGPQSSIPSMHQQPQQLSQQSSLSGMQQSQPLLSQQSNISSLQQHSHSIHQLLQAKSSIQHQQPQQAPSLLMQQQSQQSNSQPSQQQLMQQIQPQSAQQQITLQQQASSLQREMQQRIQTGGLLQPQSAVEQQKPSFQPQRVLPETSSPSIESTAQPAHPAAGDWQEEIYQKLKGLKDMYYNELNELYQKLATKCQQQEALVHTQAQSDQLDKLRSYRNALKTSLFYLIMPKNNIPLSLKDRMEMFEKQILQFLNLKNRKVLPPHQHGLQQQSGGPSLTVQQQHPQTQIPQVQQHENHTNQLQSASVQVPVTTMQTSAVTTMQHGTVPLGQHVGVPTSHNLRNVMQSASNLDSAQANNLGSLQQGAMSSLPQSGVGTMQPSMINAPQQTNASSLPQSGLSTLQQSSVNTIQSNSSMLQHQQQLKQLQQRQLQQHLVQQQHKQQMTQQPQLAPQYQQQQLPLHQKQQQAAQLQAHQMPQFHQLNDVKPGVGIKSGLFQPHNSIVQRPVHQQLKSGSSFPVSSPQLATSPQILQHSSPQIDQQSLLGAAALPKIATPLQSASSPFIVPSPSTPVTPSQLQGDSEKPGASPLSKSGNIVSQQPTVPLAQAQSLAIGTPGISASPLLAEFTIPDGNQSNAAALGSSSKYNTNERSFDRLIKAVSSVSSKAFASSISDISSTVNLVDRLACSAPGNGSRASVGEDLAATARCRLQARNLISQDGNAEAKKMKQNITAMPLNTIPSAGSVNNSVLQPASLESSELESTATSRIKRPRIEINQILLEEIKEINQKLIDTTVDVSDEDNDLTAAATEGKDGIVIKCSYNAVALCPSMKSQYALAKVSPILPLRLLVPSSYPSCSPVLLDMLPIGTGKEGEELSAKAKSMFSLSVRSLSHPMSLGDIAKTWDVCARKVMTEYAHQSGGGSFSSSYGTWESCVSA